MSKVIRTKGKSMKEEKSRNADKKHLEMLTRKTLM